MNDDSRINFSDTTLIKSIKDNLEKVKYGEVSLTLRIHDGRVVSVTNSVTENTITKGGNQKREKSMCCRGVA